MTNNYISYGDILVGRAADPAHWVEDPFQVILKEFQRIRTRQVSGSNTIRILAARSGNQLLAIGVIRLVPNGEKKVAILEDIVVHAAHRSAGFGSAIMKWLESQLSSEKVKYLFLETGVKNRAARSFFKKSGFDLVSHILMHRL